MPDRGGEKVSCTMTKALANHEYPHSVCRLYMARCVMPLFEREGQEYWSYTVPERPSASGTLFGEVACYAPSIPPDIAREDVEEAIRAFDAGVGHGFGPSTSYDQTNSPEGNILSPQHTQQPVQRRQHSEFVSSCIPIPGTTMSKIVLTKLREELFFVSREREAFLEETKDISIRLLGRIADRKSFEAITLPAHRANKKRMSIVGKGGVYEYIE